MEEYVCGLCFNLNRTYVILIEKNKPIEQAGLLNGVGGKIKSGETPSAAMQREFWEEASVQGGIDWEHFATITDNDKYRVYFFSAFTDMALKCHTKTDEKIVYRSALELRYQPLVSPLRILIPLALEENVTKPIEFVMKG